MTAPQKFRKLPVVIEAMRLDGTVESANETLAWIGGNGADAWRAHSTDPARGLFIGTLEGTVHATAGDWVIRGVKGEFYPIKDAIFKETYELAGDAS